MTTTNDHHRLKARLLERLRELDGISAEHRDERAPVELDQTSVGRLSRMDALQGQAMALELERRRAVERVRIRQALQRLEEGEYGVCAACGEDIPPRRLDLDPTAPTCIRCAG